MSCFNQHSLNYTLILELDHFSFEESLLVGIFSFDNPLASNSTIASARPAGIVKVWKTG